MIVLVILLLAVALCAVKSVRRYETPGGKYYKLYKYALSENHLLIAGITGSGKSIFIDGMISTALHRLPISKAGGAQFILIDPKGTELNRYRNLPHVLQYADMSSNPVEALQRGQDIMMKRFAYNKRHGLRIYPGSDLYIVVDELAFLLMNDKKSVEKLIQSITALGRAARVKLIVATQTPRNDVIPKMLVANIDAIIALRTNSKRESNIILGGQVDGFDGLQTLPDPRIEHRAVCYYKSAALDDDGAPLAGLFNVPMVDDAEIDRLVKHWAAQKRGLWRKQ